MYSAHYFSNVTNCFFPATRNLLALIQPAFQLYTRCVCDRSHGRSLILVRQCTLTSRFLLSLFQLNSQYAKMLSGTVSMLLNYPSVTLQKLSCSFESWNREYDLLQDMDTCLRCSRQSCVGTDHITGPYPNERVLPDVWHI